MRLNGFLFTRSVLLIVIFIERDIGKMVGCWIHPWMNDVNDAYLAIGEGTTEKKQKIFVEEI